MKNNLLFNLKYKILNSWKSLSKKKKIILIICVITSLLLITAVPTAVLLCNRHNLESKSSYTINKDTNNFFSNINDFNDLELNKQDLIEILNKLPEMQNNKLKNIKFIYDKSTTPMQIFIKLIFEKNINFLFNGYKQTNKSNEMISINPFVTKIKSENVFNNQWLTPKQNTLFYKKEIKKHKRTINNQVYDTLLDKQYKQYGFKYPGWDCNYKEQNNKYCPDGYLNVNNSKIDVMKAVFEERVPNNKNLTYNRSEFIIEEIKNNKLKKHPAALNFYEHNVLDETQAIDTEFIISSAFSNISSLGLYAPAGEIMEISFDKEFVKQVKKSNNDLTVQIVINDNYWDNVGYDSKSQTVNRNESGRISNRYPYLQSFFNINIKQLDENNPVYKFGTPFGGSIGVEFINPFIPNGTLSKGENVKFQIKNAVKSLSYFDGITTLEDWNNQVKEVYNKTISSPIISILGAFYSADLPFSNTKLHKISNIELKNAKYPGYSCKKWNDFLYLSNYWSGNDKKDRTFRLCMRYCDDVWGGAAAWGGGGNFYCPIEWGAGSFFSEKDPVNMSNWGTLHEINHNFENNEAFFQPKSHPDTNTTNLFNLSVMSDTGKFRSEFNVCDHVVSNAIIDRVDHLGWDRLSSPFNTIRVIETKPNNPNRLISEWDFLAAILYTVGSKNFVDFARENSALFPNNSKNWSGIKELAYLSNYFKMNFWNVAKKLPIIDISGPNGPHSPWHYEIEQSPEEKQIINKISNNFPSFDFVGNLYASGQYLWDKDKQDYVYTTDVTTQYQIPAFLDYNFKFDKYINSANHNFDWDSLEFSPQTKLGGTLKLDPNNKKRLIYSPNKQKVDEIDEFDILIHPTNFKDKPNNYVPGYKWKIKVRQVINKPLIYNYESFKNPISNNKEAFEQLDKLTPFSVNPIMESGTYLSFPTNKAAGSKIKFNFLAPEEVEYEFLLKWDDVVNLKINDEVVFSADQYSDNFVPIPKKNKFKKKIN